MTPRPRSWVDFYRCGLHSGFLKCCIRYWVRVWQGQSAEERRPHREAINRSTWLYGYIPCPSCLARGVTPSPTRRCHFVAGDPRCRVGAFRRNWGGTGSCGDVGPNGCRCAKEPGHEDLHATWAMQRLTWPP